MATVPHSISTEDQSGRTPKRHYLHVERPRCPACGSVDIRAYRTTRNGDESITRYSRCKCCDARLILVVE